MVNRVALGLFPYRHFGIEMQAGGVCENSPPGIRIVPMSDFAKGSMTWVQNPGATPEERARTVDRAASRIGERRYSLSANNCEHFANWCATGVAVSHQVLAFLKALAEMLISVALSYVVVSLARVTFAESPIVT